MGSRHEGSADVVTCRRPDNPGYLDGGLAALARYREATSTLPEWIILANTDLVFRTSGVVEHLSRTYEAREPLIVAPRITEGDTRVEKNPHVLNRRSRARLRTNHALTAAPILAFGYLTLSVMRRGIARLLASGGAKTRGQVSAEAGQRMYSPYGAIIIFSRGFFERIGLPGGVPLLAEEFAIAETAERHGAPVVYDPAVHVHHEPHTTTGPKITWRRARMLSTAFRYIDRSDFSTEA